MLQHWDQIQTSVDKVALGEYIYPLNCKLLIFYIFGGGVRGCMEDFVHTVLGSIAVRAQHHRSTVTRKGMKQPLWLGRALVTVAIPELQFLKRKNGWGDWICLQKKLSFFFQWTFYLEVCIVVITIFQYRLWEYQISDAIIESLRLEKAFKIIKSNR